MRSAKSYLLYCKESCANNIEQELVPGLHVSVWKPSLMNLKPRSTTMTLYTWWFYYFFQTVFKRFSYVIFLVYDDDSVVHHTIASSRCFKFPFMEKNDIQIGPSFTVPEYRNRGIASYVISIIMEHYQRDGRKFYWIAREANERSRGLVEKLGFVDCGVINKRLLLKMISIFKL